MKDMLGSLSCGLYSREKEGDEEKPTARDEKRQRATRSNPYDDHPEKRLEPTNRNEEDDFDNATRDLHDMVRHWLGLKQDCSDPLAQLRFLRDTYSMISNKRGFDLRVDRAVNAGESFEVLMSQCDTCVRRTQVYYDRIQTRINLVSSTAVLIMTYIELTLEFSCSILPINALLPTLQKLQCRHNGTRLR